MSINLHTKYAKQLDQEFKKASLLTGAFSRNVDFTGNKTVIISNVVSQNLNDYDRTSTGSRYGTIAEVQDTVQELTMSQDKSFKMAVDKGNNADQDGIKAAGKVMQIQLREKVVPERDKYCLSKFAYNAGKIAGSTTALSKSNIMTRITAGMEVLNDAEVPDDNRTLFVVPSVWTLIMLADETAKSDTRITKALSKGEVGNLFGMRVVMVPTSRVPAGFNFMIVHKSSGVVPEKIHETRIVTDSENVSGNVLLGRFYYDAFILGHKADGIYVDVTSNATGVTIVADPTFASHAISCATSGASIKYTTDGTDPRYSKTAVVYSGVFTTDPASLKAYAYKAGCYNSAVKDLI